MGTLLARSALSPAGAATALLEATSEYIDDDEPGEAFLASLDAGSLLKALFRAWRAGSSAEAVQAAWASDMAPLVKQKVRAWTLCVHAVLVCHTDACWGSLSLHVACTRSCSPQRCGPHNTAALCSMPRSSRRLCCRVRNTWACWRRAWPEQRCLEQGFCVLQQELACIPARRVCALPGALAGGPQCSSPAFCGTDPAAVKTRLP